MPLALTTYQPLPAKQALAGYLKTAADMDSLPNWAWWTIAGGILLSPVFAFLLAVLVEILIGVLTEAGLPALLILAAAATSGGLLFRKHRRRRRAGDLLGDQA
jgi:hypothetical protein